MLVKFDENGNRLWATYFGGSARDEGWDLAVDGSGSVAVTGITTSSDFPVTAGAFQSTRKGAIDIYILKFGANGLRQWATYYGGSADEWGIGTAIDGSGNIIVTGYLKSSDFPVLNAYQPVKAPADDAFAIKFNSSGTRLWASYYGGNLDDVFNYVKTDGSGNIYIAGYTRSSTFPVSNAFQPALGGGTDGLILKLSSAGIPIWATYYGGSAWDMLINIALDGAGNVLVSGLSNSSNFPVQGAYQNAIAGDYDGVAIKITPSGSRIWATYIGGSGYDNCNFLTPVDNNHFVTGGLTVSSDMQVSMLSNRRTQEGRISISSVSMKILPGNGQRITEEAPMMVGRKLRTIPVNSIYRSDRIGGFSGDAKCLPKSVRRRNA
ncbi:MAG: hypothetical protein IPP94_14895 [Ignavibacteria bacterium]|nr:hypothetical protein [Ignavibacteria bacterium]